MAAPISGIWDGTTMTMPEIDSEGVYRIRTGAELAWFAAEVNRGNGEINARLEKHIYLNDYNTYYPWIMIGDTESNPYKGHFDGNGKRILYMKVSISEDDSKRRYGGLFGVIDGGEVSDLTVMGDVHHGYGNYGKAGANDECYSGSGGIAGYLKSGRIVNCVNAATTTMSGETMYRNAGGVVGLCSGLVIRCRNQGRVSTEVNMAQNHVGGIAGMLYGTGAQAWYCVNEAEVQGYFTVGGIAGAVKYGAEIQSCCNFGAVLARSISGGIAGKLTKTGTYSNGEKKESIIRNVYSLGEMMDINRVSCGSSVGGIVGIMGYEDWKDESMPSYPVLENAYAVVGYGNTIYDYRGALVGYFKSGVAGNLYGLKGSGLQPIAVTDTKATSISGELAMKSEQEMKSPNMIKRLGGAFVMSDSYDTRNQGFPKLAWEGQPSVLSGMVDDAVLELKGWLTEENRKKYGTAYTTIELTVEKYLAQLGTVTTTEELEQIMTAAREALEAVRPGVDVDNELVEAIDNGIISLEEYESNLLEQYTDLTEEQMAELSAIREDSCKRLENASSVEEVKLLVRDGKDDMDLYIASCQEEKRVEEIRQNAKRTLESYRSDTDYQEPWAGQIKKAREDGLAAIDAAVTAAAVTEALSQAKKAIDAIIDQIPEEGAWDGVTVSEPVQDEQGVYQITSGAELAWFARQANSGNGWQYICGELCNDISLGNQNWTPIGGQVVYLGSFDGNGHTVRGLLITDADTYAGLFGNVYGTEAQSIVNLTVAGTIRCTETVSYAGGIVGNIYGKNDAERNSVRNCHSLVNITVSQVKVSGTSVGGIAGRARYTWFRDCSNSGSVVIDSEAKGGIRYFCGGIAGSIGQSVSLRRSYNSGYVSADFCAGGLVGQMDGAQCELTSNYNYGEILASTYAGGLVGCVTGNGAGGKISWGYNSGPVNLGKSGKYLGALFGGIQPGEYENLYALKRSDQAERAMVGYSADFSSPGYFLSDRELRNDEILNSLNGGGSYFIHDYLGYQSGYPIFSWQLTLEDFRNGAVTELQTFVQPEDYEEEKWVIVESLIEEGVVRIQAAGSMEEINAALTETKQAVYQVESKKEAGERKLQEAKDQAIAFLDGYVDPSQYLDEEQTKIALYLSDARKLIAMADSIEEVDRHLTETRENIDSLPTAAQYRYEQDAKAAAQVDGYIRNIGEVIFASYVKTSINIARNAYDSLTEDQKALVGEYQTLLDAEAAYQKLEEENEKSQEDAEIAAQVDALIDAIGEVTVDSEPAILAARNAFDALTDAQKTMVLHPEVLIAAEQAYDSLRAGEVAAAIAAIGEVTLEKKDVILAAQAMYAGLTDRQKELVADYPVLVAAAQTYENLVAAQKVIEMIDQIGEVTLESRSAIENAISAYNALSGDQQALVSNYDLLEAAAGRYDSLAAVDRVIGMINQIGVVSTSSGQLLADARSAYDALTPEQQAQVSNYSVLESAEAAYAALIAPEPEPDPDPFVEQGDKGQSIRDLYEQGGSIPDESQPSPAAETGQAAEEMEQPETEPESLPGAEEALPGAAGAVLQQAEEAGQDEEAEKEAWQKFQDMTVRKQEVTVLGIILAAMAAITAAIGLSLRSAAKRRREKRVHY